MKLVVMIIWGGALAHGGPATIEGFATVSSCDAARPAVERAIKDVGWSAVATVCLELDQ